MTSQTPENYKRIRNLEKPRDLENRVINWIYLIDHGILEIEYEETPYLKGLPRGGR